MQEEKISNYVKLCMEWADKIVQMDRQDLFERVPELKEENGYLTESVRQTEVSAAWMENVNRTQWRQ